MRNSKSQLGNIQGIVISLIVIGLLLGAIFIILDSFIGNLDNTPVTVTNESGAYLNETGYTVDDSSVTGFNSFSITAGWNFTDNDGTIIPVANFTVSQNGIITNASEITYANINISYTYQRGESSFVGVNDTITALLTIPELLGLVVLIAMIGVILAVIFNVIPGARVGGA